uniref:NADH-ubiquinone oxidoreductase chain 3 n=1 Tax=Haematopinus asini TaxID=1461129 RepID=A0A059TD57_9NEOP|nr:NADH dehydrogenase subunit 3 [Haematopinus asini]AHY04288.1 NADH dehydrogenase subunit 3 [Haematopinus asini]
MLKFVVWFGIVTFITVVLMFVSMCVSYTIESEFDTNDPFECGFVEMCDMHMPFCIHFFVVGLLFLVFDMELVVSLPLIMMNINTIAWIVIWLLYSLILFVGIIMEIMWGSLDWDK